MYGGVQCDMLSKDDASHMNARATLPNGRSVKQTGGRTGCIINFLEPSYFWTPLYILKLDERILIS
jgi:hypothetical protein